MPHDMITGNIAIASCLKLELDSIAARVQVMVVEAGRKTIREETKSRSRSAICRYGTLPMRMIVRVPWRGYVSVQLRQSGK